MNYLIRTLFTIFTRISLFCGFSISMYAQNNTQALGSYSNYSNYGETKIVVVESEVFKTRRSCFVKLPAEYDRTTVAYPTLYILDAADRLKFEAYCQTIDNLVENEAMPPVIIIGVLGSEGKKNYDFTPVSTNPKHKNYGGASDFLRFLRTDLLPFIDGSYRTSNYRILIGHSFAGLFATYALVQQPDMFQHVIAVSPTMWYNDGIFIEKVDSFAKKCRAPHSFFFAVGDEGDTEVSLRPSVMQLYDRLKLRNCPPFHWQFLELHDKNHRITPIFAVPEALCATFKAWKISAITQKAIEKKTGDPLTLLEQHADFRKKQYGLVFDWSANDYVYYLVLPYLDAKNELQAKAILKEALLLYPKSSLLLECLGDLNVLQGDFEQAKTSYEAALNNLTARESGFKSELKEKIAFVATKLK